MVKLNNLRLLSRVEWVMNTSLTKTLAAKLKVSVPQVCGRYMTAQQGRRMLTATIAHEGRKPLVAMWGRTDLVRRTGVRHLPDSPARIAFERNELVRRLLAGTCELCRAQEAIEVHHIRALKDVSKLGRRGSNRPG